MEIGGSTIKGDKVGISPHTAGSPSARERWSRNRRRGHVALAVRSNADILARSPAGVAVVLTVNTAHGFLLI